MEIRLVSMHGLHEALFGLGLSHSVTSDIDSVRGPTAEARIRERVLRVAEKLAGAGGGEDKFLRQIQLWYDVRAPRFMWQEIDTYRVGTCTQSESTMHTLHKVEKIDNSLFEFNLPPFLLGTLQSMLERYKETKDIVDLLILKNALPEGFLQRRIWNINMAVAKNIVRQRRRHRLPQWRQICRRLVDDCPGFLSAAFPPEDADGRAE